MADSDRRDLTRMVRSLVAQGGTIADRTRQALTDGDIIEAMARTIEAAGVEFVRRWHRLEVTPTRVDTDGPVLFVANHGFGGIIDLNVFALVAALGDLELDRPVTFLVHELAWTLRLNALIEPLGAQPAGPDAARDAFARGDHVVVFPGGDLNAFRAFPDRNRVVFGGRTGFARLALEEGIPCPASCAPGCCRRCHPSSSRAQTTSPTWSSSACSRRSTNWSTTPDSPHGCGLSGCRWTVPNVGTFRIEAALHCNEIRGVVDACG